MSGETKSATQVRIAGEAGQGVILAGVILAQAAMGDGRRVAQSARYGAAVRGGDATADVIISDAPIDFPHVEAPDFLVALSQPTYDLMAKAQRAGTSIIHDPFFVKPVELDGPRQFPVAATEKAIERFGRGTSANLVVLGFLSEASGVVSWESLAAAVEGSFPARHRAANMEALEIGRRAAREAR